MTKTKISVKELVELEHMLNGSSEDYEVAISNIKNLDLKTIYITLLYKNIDSSKKHKFLEEFDMNTVRFIKYSFNSIYNTIANDESLIEDNILKDYFKYSIERLITDSFAHLSLPILEQSIKIKWPISKTQ